MGCREHPSLPQFIGVPQHSNDQCDAPCTVFEEIQGQCAATTGAFGILQLTEKHEEHADVDENDWIWQDGQLEPRGPWLGDIAQERSASLDVEDCTPETPKETDGLMTGSAVRSESEFEMEASWLTDPRASWRHPLARIFVAVFIMVLDFYIYGEDPVNDSRVEYNYPVLGHVYGLLCLWPDEVQLRMFRVAIIIISFLSGCYVGRQWIHHRLLRDLLGLTMFEENKGTWFVMAMPALIGLYLGAMTYNLAVAESNQITSRTYVGMHLVGKYFQCLSIFLDIISIAQIADAVLQDKEVFPDWAPRAKHIWNETCRGWIRVLAVWAFLVTSVYFSFAGIFMTGHAEGSICWDNRTIGGLTEVSRTLIVNLVIFMDLVSVMQDWEFPTFQEALDIMIAGTFSTKLSCNCISHVMRSLCTRLPRRFIDFFRVTITGPWLTYGPLLAVMGADIACAKTQFQYNPADFGQYVDPRSGRIWTILDVAYLETAYVAGALMQPELVTMEARRSILTGAPLTASAATDVELNSRHLHSSMESVAIIPGLTAIVAFVMLVFAAERGSAPWRWRAAMLLVASFISFFTLAAYITTAAGTISGSMQRPPEKLTQRRRPPQP